MNAEITGIGGIFIKVAKPEATLEWYRSILGIELGEYGGVFDPKHPDNGDAYINFSFFPKNTDYFQPSSHELMLNFRVNHL